MVVRIKRGKKLRVENYIQIFKYPDWCCGSTDIFKHPNHVRNNQSLGKYMWTSWSSVWKIMPRVHYRLQVLLLIIRVRCFQLKSPIPKYARCFFDLRDDACNNVLCNLSCIRDNFLLVLSTRHSLHIHSSSPTSWMLFSLVIFNFSITGVGIKFFENLKLEKNRQDEILY